MPDPNPEGDVLAQIGALVNGDQTDTLIDQQLARGERRAKTSPWCNCGQPWHGLPENGCPGTHQAGESNTEAWCAHRLITGTTGSRLLPPPPPSGLGIDYALRFIPLTRLPMDSQEFLARLLSTLNVPTDSAAAGQLRQILSAHPELSSMTALRDYLMDPDRPQNHMSTEIATVAAQLVVRTRPPAAGPRPLEPWRRAIGKIPSTAGLIARQVPAIYELARTVSLLADERRRRDLARFIQDNRGPNRLLSVTEDTPDGSRLLGYIPCPSPHDQMDTYRTAELPEFSPTTLRVNRHGGRDAIIETKPVSPAQAAALLLRVTLLNLSEKLLHDGGVPGFIDHFRRNPATSPGSSRRTRRRALQLPKARRRSGKETMTACVPQARRDPATKPPSMKASQ